MSQMIDFTLPSCQPGRTLHAFRCVPEGEVRAVLQLSHGMVEFIDRYKPLAENLAARGILVTGNDHPHQRGLRLLRRTRRQPRRAGGPARCDDPDKAAVSRRALFPAGPQHGLIPSQTIPQRIRRGTIGRCYHGHRCEPRRRSKAGHGGM